MSDARGYLALVLHAHLPFVRHPEHGDFLEERWLFEAMTETYIPLLGVLRTLARDGVPFRLTLSLTPPLVNMLEDSLLQHRYLQHLDRLIAFSEQEVERTREDPSFQRLAVLYRDLLRQTRRSFTDVHEGNLVPAFRRLQDDGHVSIVACAATHGFLPLLCSQEGAVRAQVRIGVEEYQRVFGREPRGIWLPECGFYPGLEEVLAEHRLRYFIVETHGVLYARPRPVFGPYAPVVTPAGPAAFARDPHSSRQVWSADSGYPGDHDYRDFYRDVGFDLDYDYVRPLLPGSGERVPTGFKYHRITGPTAHKEPYNPDWAAGKIDAHAANFVGSRERQVAALAERLGSPPIVTAPYDAELFGHWWFEGPRWLDRVLRKAAYDQHVFELITIEDYLERHPVAQEAMPAASSWGEGGHGAVWLSGENDWVYRHLHVAADRMAALARLFPEATGLKLRALNQAARELLLAQASDWTFIMSRGTAVEYAVQRVRTHLARLLRLDAELRAGRIDAEWLADIEAGDNVFPAIDYRGFS